MSVFGKLSANSKLTVNKELDYFKTPPTETTELSSHYISVRPTSITDNQTVINLNVTADNSKATDLNNSVVIVKGKFVKTDGTNLPAHDHGDMKVVADTNLAHSLWEKLTLRIKNDIVFVASNYGQLAHLKTSLFTSAEEKETRMEMEGWLKDDMDPARDYENIGADALSARKKLIAEGKTVTLAFVPCTMFSDAKRYIPPNTELDLELRKAAASMFTLSSEENPGVEFKLDSIKWYVRRVVLNPGVVQALNTRMVAGAELQIPLLKPRLRSFLINDGINRAEINITNQETLPLIFAIGLVKQAHFVGSSKHTPLKLTPCGVRSVELKLNGSTHGLPLEMDYANGDAIHAYQHTMEALGQGYGQGMKCNGLTYNQFKTNKTVYAWNLSNNCPSEWGDIFHLKKQCSMQVVINFTANTTQALTLAVYDIREDLLRQDLEGRAKCIESAE